MIQSRLRDLENSLTRITGRVIHIESSRARTAPPKSTSYHEQPTVSGQPDRFEDGHGDTVDTDDPTDGIGSMSFSKEEECGFFGLLLHSASPSSQGLTENRTLIQHSVHTSDRVFTDRSIEAHRSN